LLSTVVSGGVAEYEAGSAERAEDIGATEREAKVERADTRVEDIVDEVDTVVEKVVRVRVVIVGVVDTVVEMDTVAEMESDAAATVVETVNHVADSAVVTVAKEDIVDADVDAVMVKDGGRVRARVRARKEDGADEAHTAGEIGGVAVSD
jgi:hypothetical protein